MLLEPGDRRLEEVRRGVDLRAEHQHAEFVHRQERQREEQPGRERARDVEVAALRGEAFPFELFQLFGRRLILGIEIVRFVLAFTGIGQGRPSPS